MLKLTFIKNTVAKLTPLQREIALNTFRELWSKYDAQVKYYRELMSKRVISQTYYRRVTKTQRQDLISQVRSNLKTIRSLV